jgi:hypothetical protein
MMLLLVMMMMIAAIIIISPQTAIKQKLANTSVTAVTAVIVEVVIMIVKILIITSTRKALLAEVKDGNTQQPTYLYDV